MGVDDRVIVLCDLYGLDGSKTEEGSRAVIESISDGLYSLQFADGSVRPGFLAWHFRVISPLELLAEQVE